jgi:hypothetical protein
LIIEWRFRRYIGALLSYFRHNNTKLFLNRHFNFLYFTFNHHSQIPHWILSTHTCATVIKFHYWFFIWFISLCLFLLLHIFYLLVNFFYRSICVSDRIYYFFLHLEHIFQFALKLLQLCLIKTLNWSYTTQYFFDISFRKFDKSIIFNHTNLHLSFLNFSINLT